jgi:hypothetical protein
MVENTIEEKIDAKERHCKNAKTIVKYLMDSGIPAHFAEKQAFISDCFLEMCSEGSMEDCIVRQYFSSVK